MPVVIVICTLSALLSPAVPCFVVACGFMLPLIACCCCTPSVKFTQSQSLSLFLSFSLSKYNTKRKRKRDRGTAASKRTRRALFLSVFFSSLFLFFSFSLF